MTKTEVLTYPVVEMFHSVQGEGHWAGTSAFFVRLGGCDVGCWFCDTKESWNAKRHPQRSVEEIAAAAIAARPAIAVITGGEPLLHDLGPLTQALRSRGLRVQLETSGAHPFSGDLDWVTLSPKTFKAPHPSVYPRVSELKVVIAQTQDFAWAEEQAAQVPASALRLLQPEWSTPESQQLIFDYVLQHPQWRVSLQTHKFLGVR